MLFPNRHFTDKCVKSSLPSSASCFPFPCHTVPRVSLSDTRSTAAASTLISLTPRGLYFYTCARMIDDAKGPFFQMGLSCRRPVISLMDQTRLRSADQSF